MLGEDVGEDVGDFAENGRDLSAESFSADVLQCLSRDQERGKLIRREIDHGEGERIMPVVVALSGEVIPEGASQAIPHEIDVTLGGLGGDFELPGQGGGVRVFFGLDLGIEPDKAFIDIFRAHEISLVLILNSMVNRIPEIFKKVHNEAPGEELNH